MQRQACFIVARCSVDDWVSLDWQLALAAGFRSGDLERTAVLARLPDLSDKEASAIAEALQTDVSDWVPRPLLSVEPEAETREDLAHYLLWSRGAEQRAERLLGATRDQAEPSPIDRLALAAMEYAERLRQLRFEVYDEASPNQTRLLDAFQELGWPRRIDDPIPLRRDPDRRQRLADTVPGLNSSKGLSFELDGTGEGVIWKPAQDEGSAASDGPDVLPFQAASGGGQEIIHRGPGSAGQAPGSLHGASIKLPPALCTIVVVTSREALARFMQALTYGPDRPAVRSPANRRRAAERAVAALEAEGV